MTPYRCMAPDEVCSDEECVVCGAIAKEVGYEGWTQSLGDWEMKFCPDCSREEEEC